MTTGEQPGRLVLLGHPLGHSLSPVMQNAALRAASIDMTYEKLDVPRSVLDDTVARLRKDRGAGNVTRPYKLAMADECDRLSDTARAIGAINTFWTAPDGALVGDNTDVVGFEAACARLLGEGRTGQKVALLGAGGAAAAVLHAMKKWPDARVILYSRTQKRAEELAARFGIPAELARSAEDAAQKATLLVNATPVGLRDDTTPINVAAIPRQCFVLDLAYRSNETALVRDARARGLRALDGLTMLVEQGAASFERWFGREPNREVMWEAVRSTR